jgi:hypothetical protein
MQDDYAVLRQELDVRGFDEHASDVEITYTISDDRQDLKVTYDAVSLRTMKP